MRFGTIDDLKKIRNNALNPKFDHIKYFDRFRWVFPRNEKFNWSDVGIEYNDNSIENLELKIIFYSFHQNYNGTTIKYLQRWLKILTNLELLELFLRAKMPTFFIKDKYLDLFLEKDSSNISKNLYEYLFHNFFVHSLEKLEKFLHWNDKFVNKCNMHWYFIRNKKLEQTKYMIENYDFDPMKDISKRCGEEKISLEYEDYDQMLEYLKTACTNTIKRVIRSNIIEDFKDDFDKFIDKNIFECAITNGVKVVIDYLLEKYGDVIKLEIISYGDMELVDEYLPDFNTDMIIELLEN